MSKQLNKFELGKCYEHSSGKQIYICGIVDTILYATCFVAEQNDSCELAPIAMNSKDATANWKKLSKKKFIKKNFCK